MQHFTIRDIENLCGIKAHTLRIWEQRYDFFVPKRKESQHRIYENEDLQQLLRVAFLYHNGWKISRIAALNQEEIAHHVTQHEITSTTYKSFILQLTEAAVDFNETRFVGILNSLIDKIGFERTVTDVCYPFLNRVGLLWMTNNIIPAQEHFSSAIIQNKIIAETEKLPLIVSDPTIVLFAPAGEHHELPLVYLNYLLRKNRWSVVYLGCNVKKEMLKQVSRAAVHYLYFHLITNFTGQEPWDYVMDICRSFPTKTIVVSGSVATEMEAKADNVRILRTDQEIYDFITKQDTVANPEVIT
jgi:DNA-binding transcriptional MerR regulator